MVGRDEKKNLFYLSLSTFKVLPGVNYYGNSSVCLIWLHMTIIGALWNYIGGLGK